MLQLEPGSNAEILGVPSPLLRPPVAAAQRLPAGGGPGQPRPFESPDRVGARTGSEIGRPARPHASRVIEPVGIRRVAGNLIELVILIDEWVVEHQIDRRKGSAQPLPARPHPCAGDPGIVGVRRDHDHQVDVRQAGQEVCGFEAAAEVCGGAPLAREQIGDVGPCRQPVGQCPQPAGGGGCRTQQQLVDCEGDPGPGGHGRFRYRWRTVGTP